jgi:hypothetical protein
MRRGLLSVTALIVLAGAPVPATAQLSRLIPDLVFQEVAIAPSPQGTAGFPHTAHFSPLNPLFGAADSETQQTLIEQTAFVSELNRQINSQLATFPLGSSAGGFTYRFDPALGTFTRTSESFGPSFAERAYTIGRNKFSFGTSWIATRYDSFEGRELEDPTIRFVFPHNDCCPGQTLEGVPAGDRSLLNPFFEGDVLEGVFLLDLTTSTTSFFANYGVTNALEVGMVLPIASVDIDAVVDTRIVRLSTSAAPTIHSFDNAGQVERQFSSRGSATGLGDILLRAKYLVADLPAAGGGFSAAVDVRLPTGDEMDLLGTGALQTKIFAIGSATLGRTSPHVNIGYTISGDVSEEAEDNFVEAPPDEFNYAAGVDVALTPKLTLAGDLIGRRLFDVQRMIDEPLFFRYTAGAGGPVLSQRFDGFTLREGDLDLVLGVIGAKVNFTRTLILSVSALFSLTESGLQNRVTPVIGFDYTLGR